MTDKIYNTHRSFTREQFTKEIQGTPINKERSIVIKYISRLVKGLDNLSITEYLNFTDTLKKIGFKSVDIQNYIIGFHQFINNSMKINDSFWLNNRFIQKSNLNEKNLIINYMAAKYPNELLYFTKQYIETNFSIMMKVDIFFKEFQDKIQKLVGLKDNDKPNISIESIEKVCLNNIENEIAHNEKVFFIPTNDENVV